MEHLELQQIADKIDQLIDINKKLRDENRTLKAAHAGWEADRVKLTQQNELARKKISDMIGRLQALEASR